MYFDRRVEAQLIERPDCSQLWPPIRRTWRQLREQIAAFDKVIRTIVRESPSLFADECARHRSADRAGVSEHSRKARTFQLLAPLGLPP